MSKENRKLKDSVFVDLFYNSKDAERNALSLYNALTGSDFQDISLIEKLKIDDVAYKDFVNDVSFKIGNIIMFFGEHQSTLNLNMPLRFLLYAGRVYEKITKEDDRYRNKLIYLPVPEFYVFYNGEKEYPEYSELHLSDAFPESLKRRISDLEITVHIYNINNGHNQELLEKCSTLKQYSQFIDVVRKKKNAPEQYKEAIKECINQNILSDYLREKGSEVINMLVAEYNYEKDIRIKQEEAYEDGVEAGKMQDCIEMCQQLGISMEKTLEIFQERFKINATDAQMYLKKYWKK